MASGAQSPLRERPIQFGKYTLLARIASGGMGELYLAQLRSAGGFAKLVVIKRILSHLTDKPEFVDMFVAEARTAALISHPNVCQIYELGQVDGRFYMALEYLEGVPLADVMVARKKAPQLADLRLVASLVAQTAEGLFHAHSLRDPDGETAQVVHRDVNPRNVFVTSAGVSKVLDFGIVKVRGAIGQIQTGSVKGTYSYMAPEQLQGEAVDCTADIFALGTITWEAVVGRRLFKRSSDLLTWRAIVEEPIPRATKFRPDLPPDLDDAIARALARQPAERFQSAREFSSAVEQAIRPLGTPLTTLAIAAEMEKAFAVELGAQRERVFAAHRREEAERSGEAPVDAEAAAVAAVPEVPEALEDWESGGNRTTVAEPGYAELIARMAKTRSQELSAASEAVPESTESRSGGLDIGDVTEPVAAPPRMTAPAPVGVQAVALPRPSQLPSPAPPPAYVVEEAHYPSHAAPAAAGSAVDVPVDIDVDVDDVSDDELERLLHPRRRWLPIAALALSAATGAALVLILNRPPDEKPDDAGDQGAATQATVPAVAGSVVAGRDATQPSAAGAASAAATPGANPGAGAAPGGAASPAPIGAAASPAPIGGAASPAPIGGAASPAPIGGAASPAPIGGAASPAPIGGAASAAPRPSASTMPSASTARIRTTPPAPPHTPSAAAAGAAAAQRSSAGEAGEPSRAGDAARDAEGGRNRDVDRERLDRARDARRDRRPEKTAAAAPAAGPVAAARDGGFLTINAEPYATLYVDGKKRGLTPVVRLALAAGAHRLRLVSSPGQARKDLRVRIVSGQELRKFVKW